MIKSEWQKERKRRGVGRVRQVAVHLFLTPIEERACLCVCVRVWFYQLSPKQAKFILCVDAIAGCWQRWVLGKPSARRSFCLVSRHISQLITSPTGASSHVAAAPAEASRTHDSTVKWTNSSLRLSVLRTFWKTWHQELGLLKKKMK